MTIRRSLAAFCAAAFCAWIPAVQSQPRLLSDEEMDQVCAKGSVGMDAEVLASQQFAFHFQRPTSVGLVNGSAVFTVETLSSPSGNTQITVGMPTAAAFGADEIPTTQIQVVNGTVRVRGDINIDLQALPGALRALQQNRLIMPVRGISPIGTTFSMGGLR